MAFLSDAQDDVISHVVPKSCYADREPVGAWRKRASLRITLNLVVILLAELPPQIDSSSFVWS